MKKFCWRYYHFTHLYEKSQSYNVWFLRYEVRQAEFFVILGYFLSFQPPDNPENQNLKLKKTPGDIMYNFTHLHCK